MSANFDYKDLIRHLFDTGTSARDIIPKCRTEFPEVSYKLLVDEIKSHYPNADLPPAPEGEEEPEEVFSPTEEKVLGALFNGIVSHIKSGESLDYATEQAKILNPALAHVAMRRVKKYLQATNSWPYGSGFIGNNGVNGDPNNGWYGGPKTDSILWHSLVSEIRAEGKMTEGDIAVLNDATTRTLSMMPAPGRPEFSGRGLVMGYVQSGKTTNFMGLAAKAADEGYKLIIVLSGLTNNLRDQTQKRLEKVLTGGQPDKWHWLTHDKEDFTTKHNADNLLSAANSSKLIAVVKKNTSRLNLLHKWISRGSDLARQNLQVLIIDDECDQATINTARQKDARTAINKALRKLVDPSFLPRASYVGYSATPYANFLIDTTEDDGLYPKDFIVSLNKGKGYFGAAELFGRDALDDGDEDFDGADIIRDIPNGDVDVVKPPKGDQSSWMPGIPSSLKDSIGWFVIANSIRRIRGGVQDWSTMMVHTSPNVEPHRKSAEAIKDLVTSWAEMNHDELERILEPIYVQEISRAMHLESEPEIEWSQIFGAAISTLEVLRVIVDNYKSEDRLNYDTETPYPIIVVGGNTLARGLTLEGLVSTFFLRTSNAYDALMQMGRWFGYRPGYADLQRIWLANDDPYHLSKWFRDLAFVEDEIRTQIEAYSLEGYTPLQVGIKIRKLPGMAITSAAKQRHAVAAQLSYAGSRIQTILFEKDELKLQNNIQSLKDFASDLKIGQLPTNSDGWPVAYGVSADKILNFIKSYLFEPGSKALQYDAISKYVNNLRKSGELEKWNVAFYNNGRQTAPEFEFAGGLKLRMANRAQMKSEKDPNRIDIKTLISVGDMVADKPALKDKCRSDFGPGLKQAALQKLRNDDVDLRGVPLLGIYVIDKDSTPSAAESKHRVPLKAGEHVVGLYFVFPQTDNPDAAVFYTANLIELADLEELDEQSEVIEEPVPIDSDGQSFPAI